MPRPPILPLLDWKWIFQSGKTYTEWLAGGESPENQRAMEAARQSGAIDSTVQDCLAKLPRPVHVIAIAEDWCGDVVRHVPVLQKLAEVTPDLRVRYITRQQWPEVFVRFLTNGGEAIPKFIFLNDTFTECGNWGPMPEAYRELIARGKACGNIAAARQKVGELYASPECEPLVISELVHLIDIASCGEP